MSQSIVRKRDENVFRTLKRKRKSEECLEHTADVTIDTNTCFINSAFSSTPKKVVLRRRTQNPITNVVVQDTCLEVKSISDIIKRPVEKTDLTKIDGDALSQNPYEVQRKPPKKKKRESEIVEACFENPALNLELPEKQFNPYEVTLFYIISFRNIKILFLFIFIPDFDLKMPKKIKFLKKYICIHKG